MYLTQPGERPTISMMEAGGRAGRCIITTRACPRGEVAASSRERGFDSRSPHSAMGSVRGFESLLEAPFYGALPEW